MTIESMRAHVRARASAPDAIDDSAARDIGGAIDAALAAVAGLVAFVLV